MFIYDVIEDLMNINEAVKMHCVLMKCLKFQIAISRKLYEKKNDAVFSIDFVAAMSIKI